jgi:hypothetical protein
MLVNPFHRELSERYPDETLTPTAVTHFSANETWVTTSAPDFVLKILHQDLEGARVWNKTYEGTFGTGVPPGTITGLDYGNQYAAYTRLASIHRTLSYGLRLQITGLPSATFAPAGRWYFLQLPEKEMAVGAPNTSDDTLAFMTFNSTGEAAAMAAVNAGKGFTITSQELYNTPGGIHIPYLPSGPQSLLFKDAFTANTFAGNAAPWPSSLASAVPSEIYSTGTNLICIGYGIPQDMSLTFSFAHHTEYVPSTGAAGIVDVKCAESSVAVRDGIAKGSQVISQSLHGSTNVQEVRNILGPSATKRKVDNYFGTGMMGNITQNVGRIKSVYDTVSPIVESFIKAFGA